MNRLETLSDDFLLVPLFFNPSEINRPSSFNLVNTPLKTTGPVFVASEQCSERFGENYLTACEIPQHISFRAAPASDFHGNKELEKMTFYNRIIATFTGHCQTRGAGYVIDDGFREPALIQTGGRLEVDNHFTGHGEKSIHFHATPKTNTATLFRRNTKLNVIVNYIYPDVAMLDLYTRSLIKFSTTLADIYQKFSETDDYLQTIGNLTSGIELLKQLLDEPGLDEITKFQINSVMKQMIYGKNLISRDCQAGQSQSCQNRVSNVLKIISSEMDLRSSEMISLKLFLQDEKERLTQIRNVDLNIKKKIASILALTRPSQVIDTPSDEEVNFLADREQRLINGEEVAFYLKNLSDHESFRNLEWKVIHNHSSLAGDSLYGTTPLQHGKKTIMKMHLPLESSPPLRYLGLRQDHFGIGGKGPIWEQSFPNDPFTFFHTEPILSPARLNGVLSGSTNFIRELRIRLLFNAIRNKNGYNTQPNFGKIALFMYDNNNLYPRPDLPNSPRYSPPSQSDPRNERRNWPPFFGDEWVQGSAESIIKLDIKAAIESARRLYRFTDVGLACGCYIHSTGSIQFKELKIQLLDVEE